MIYVGETITLRYTGEYKDSGKFTVFGNEQDYLKRTPDGYDSTPDGENYRQAAFIGNKAGKCRIVYLDDKNSWGEDHVTEDLWVQVIDPVYVKTYYGDKGKDLIKEYLGGYDWIKDKNGYIQNTSGKPYILRVGDVISIRSDANGNFTLDAGHYFFAKDSVLVSAKNDANGKVTFPYLAYSEKDKGKTFTYYMREAIDSDNPDVSEYDKTVHEVKITVGEDMSVTVKYDGEDNAPTFRNTLREYQLPNTGGGGVIPYMTFGAGLITTAFILLVRKKRRESG